MPIQKPPPVWVVPNPRLKGKEPTAAGLRQLRKICHRIVKYGDGWMTCCRAQHPEEFVQQLEIHGAADGAIDQFRQVECFAKEVLPIFAAQEVA